MVKSHIKSQIGARIKAARKAAGYTQPGLAEAMGLESHMAVSRWERGKNMPSEENARDLCRILGRPEKYFLGEEKPTKTVSELTHMLEDRDAEIEALKASLQRIGDIVSLLTSLDQSELQDVRDFLKGRFPQPGSSEKEE